MGAACQEAVRVTFAAGDRGGAFAQAGDAAGHGPALHAWYSRTMSFSTGADGSANDHEVPSGLLDRIMRRSMMVVIAGFGGLLFLHPI